MVQRMERLEQTAIASRWGIAAAAGIGAGIVAGLASVGVLIVMGAKFPPHAATFQSALVAGFLGGLLYGWLSRISRRPVAALWVITLVIATIDTLLVAALPLPAGRPPSIGAIIYGLAVPVQQLLALVGVGHLGTRHLPAAFIAPDAATHYVTAAAVSLLVPWWARGRRV